MRKQRCPCGALNLLRKGLNHKLIVHIQQEVERLDPGSILSQGIYATLTRHDTHPTSSKVLVEATIAALIRLTEEKQLAREHAKERARERSKEKRAAA